RLNFLINLKRPNFNFKIFIIEIDFNFVFNIFSIKLIKPQHFICIDFEVFPSEKQLLTLTFSQNHGENFIR
ncbi:MAG: hypothetical protein EBT63_06345, partial [Proteobacteria bacterium]|nr:hypothetical protein [Pseudomonadota bacterium]